MSQLPSLTWQSTSRQHLRSGPIWRCRLLCLVISGWTTQETARSREGAEMSALRAARENERMASRHKAVPWPRKTRCWPLLALVILVLFWNVAVTKRMLAREMKNHRCKQILNTPKGIYKKRLFSGIKMDWSKRRQMRKMTKKKAQTAEAGSLSIAKQQSKTMPYCTPPSSALAARAKGRTRRPRAAIKWSSASSQSILSTLSRPSWRPKESNKT